MPARADRAADLELAIGFATHEMTVASRDRDGWTGGDDLRHWLAAAAKPVAQCSAKVVAIAQVANRRDTGRQCLSRRQTHAQQESGIRVLLHLGDRIAAGVEAEEDMGIDQPGQQGHIAEIQHIGVRRRRDWRRLDADNARTVDKHQRLLDQTGAPAVEQAGHA